MHRMMNYYSEENMLEFLFHLSFDARYGAFVIKW